MPNLPFTPAEINVPNSINLRYFTLDRFGPDTHTPEVRILLTSGFYPKDDQGNPIPNALGFNTFKPTPDMNWEVTLPLTQPTLQSILLSMDTEVREYIAANPEVPLLAVFDNWLTNAALTYYAHVNNLPELEEPEGHEDPPAEAPVG